MRLDPLFKHKNNTDVAFTIINSVYSADKKKLKLRISWVNIVNPDKHYHMGIRETIYLCPAVFLKDWDSLDYCP